MKLKIKKVNSEQFEIFNVIDYKITQGLSEFLIDAHAYSKTLSNEITTTNPESTLPECQNMTSYGKKSGFNVDFPATIGFSVYYIEDSITGEVLYIGKSSDGCLSGRIRKHRNSKIFDNTAINIYVYVSKTEVDSLILEQYMIAMFQPRYNKLKPSERSFLNIKIPTFHMYVSIDAHGKVINFV